MPAAAAVAAVVGSSILQSDAQRKAGNRAADAQRESAQMGIDEQQRQFDAMQKLLAPYVSAGNGALSAQQNLVGLNGNDAQSAAISAIKSSPQMQALLQRGENSILQNASATGGLRGGNTEAALAQYSPQLLAQLISDQYGKLGGLTSIGANAAAMTGNAGMQTGNAIAALLGQQGSANAGAALNAGAAQQKVYGIPGQLGAMYLGGGFGGFGGAGASPFAGAGSSALAGAGGTAGSSFFSDARLKTDLVRVGSANGLPLYRFRYVWGGPPCIGHLAHEVRERFPHAVREHASGFLTVDYGALDA